jgi:predicted membrane protein
MGRPKKNQEENKPETKETTGLVSIIIPVGYSIQLGNKRFKGKIEVDYETNKQELENQSGRWYFEPKTIEPDTGKEQE